MQLLHCLWIFVSRMQSDAFFSVALLGVVFYLVFVTMYNSL